MAVQSGPVVRSIEHGARPAGLSVGLFRHVENMIRKARYFVGSGVVRLLLRCVKVQLASEMSGLTWMPDCLESDQVKWRGVEKQSLCSCVGFENEDTGANLWTDRPWSG